MKAEPRQDKKTWRTGWNRVKKTLTNFCHSVKRLIDDALLSRKKTLWMLALVVLTVLFGVQILIILVRNSFYNNFSDDILQYYTIIVDFIRQLKDGSISLFNLNNYLGASIFSDIYYVPLDIFTGITFVLSFLMPTQLAYSITEFIKILAGVMVFAIYLSKQGMKNRTVFWGGIVYFISGGTVSFMAFPAFLSLVFYLPLALLVIHWSFKGKKWVVPLFAMALVFYNFYLAYTALIFTGIMYIVEYIKRSDFHFGRFIRDGVIFLLLCILGVAMSLVVFYPSVLFILEDTFRDSGTFNAWVINIGSIEIKLFQPMIYMRFLAKMFAEQRPIGFYGFAQDYTKEHVSLYITMTGLALMNYVFFLKDRISKIYKVLIPFGLILMFFPLFSYVFSGTLDVPYTRWINVYPLIQVMIFAHVFDAKGFEQLKPKWLSISTALLLVVNGGVIYYYIDRLITLEDFKFADALIADTAIMGVSAVILILMIVFVWIRKNHWFKYLFWVEFAVSICFIYSGPFSIVNKNDMFETMYQIQDFLEEHLDHDSFYRVYVDLDRFNAERTNFNRMTAFPTNTRIFHSWTDKETDMLAELLFGQVEHQTKEVLEVQALYLNQFLGYKYVLASQNYTYYLDGSLYRLIAENEEFQLLEIIPAKPFQVFESYVSHSGYKSYRTNNNKVQAQKVLLQHALVDVTERYSDLALNLESKTLSGISTLRTLSPTKNVSVYDTVNIAGLSDPSVRSFLRFGAPVFDVGYSAGAIYIKSSTDTAQYGEVFVEFEGGAKHACTINTDPNIPHDVKCEFGAEPIAIYFEAEQLPMTFNFQYRRELAREGAAYLVYDLANINFSRDKGMLYFELSKPFERVFFVDENGQEFEGFKNYYYYDTRPELMYVFKTWEMYQNVPDLYNFRLSYAYDDLSDFDEAVGTSLSDNEFLSIDHGKIDLRYTRTSDSTYDQLVVVPVAYSEEWQFVSDTQYETISASGGFLGIIIPADVDIIEIEMRFVPKGLAKGALASGGATLVYLGIFLPIWIVKRRHKKNQIPQEELSE